MGYKDGIFSVDEREELIKAALSHTEDEYLDKLDSNELKSAREEIKTGKMTFDGKEKELSMNELDNVKAGRPLDAESVDDFLKNHPGVFKN